MLKHMLLQVGTFMVLALAVLLPQTANAAPAGPSQQIREATGSGDLTVDFRVPTGTTRFWVYRLDGDGVLSARAVEGFRLLPGDEDDKLTFESAASNSVPVPEPAVVVVGIHHNTWSTTRLLLTTEIGGRVADADVGRDPWMSAKTNLVWPISTKGNGALGGLNLAANKPLGGSWVGLVETDTNWEGATRGLSSQSGSDWQALRFGFGFGQSRPYGMRWSASAGLDFGQYGVGASRPLYAKVEADRTALPGQPVEARGQALATFGPNGTSIGGNAGWDFRLAGPFAVGLSADAKVDPDWSYHAAAGPALGWNAPIGGNTLRIRTGARLGVMKDAAGKSDGIITPFLQMGLQKGN